MSKPRSRRQADQEWDALASALNRLGVKHVAPGARQIPVPMTACDLFVRLAISRSVRLQEAAVLLLLTHPDLDGAARQAIDALEATTRRRAMHRYVAACALQRMWRTRLQSDLGPRRLIEPAYLAELRLPPLEVDFGRETLLALSNHEEEEFGYDAWAGYTSLMDLFLGELIDPTWGQIRA